MNIYDKISKTVYDNGLLSGASGVVLAVSGGPDSMTLLDWFEKKRPCVFCAAHINHSLRPEADDDERFVKKYCDSRGIDFFSEKVDITGLCPRGVSIETFARSVRYSFFDKVRGQTGFSHIATAHNLSDNIETLIMNIVRGCGISGLCAIPYKREDLIIRPLIEISKDEILLHCREENIPFTVDSTNFENICTRNIVRNSIIPLIKQINPSFEKTPLIYLAKQCTEYIGEKAEEVLGNSFNGTGLLTEPLKQLSDAVLFEVIRRAFSTISGGEILDFFHTRAVADLIRNSTVSGKTGLIAGYTARMSYKEIFFEKEGSGYFRIEKTPLVNGDNYISGLGTVVIEAEDCSDLYIRSREQGDRIVHNGKAKTLKKLFIDEKIPVAERGKYFIIEKNGKIIYVRDFYCENPVKIRVYLKKSNI